MISRSTAIGGTTAVATAAAAPGGGLVVLSTIALITLKLVGTISLSWWFCICGPFVIALAFGVAAFLVGVILFGVTFLIIMTIWLIFVAPFTWRRRRKAQALRRQVFSQFGGSSSWMK